MRLVIMINTFSVPLEGKPALNTSTEREPEDPVTNLETRRKQPWQVNAFGAEYGHAWALQVVQY